MELCAWTTADVMRALGISRTKVYELCERGQLRHAKIGRVYRFAPAWIEDYVRRVTAGPAEVANP